jgi:hypothetical protein
LFYSMGLHDLEQDDFSQVQIHKNYFPKYTQRLTRVCKKFHVSSFHSHSTRRKKSWRPLIIAGTRYTSLLPLHNHSRRQQPERSSQTPQQKTRYGQTD